MAFKKIAYSKTKKVIIYGTGSLAALFLLLLTFQNYGIQIETSPDIICGTNCTSYFNISVTNYSLCFNKNFTFYTTPETPVYIYKADNRYSKTNPARWKLYNLTGKCLTPGKYEFKIMGNKPANETIKWGVSYGKEVDPIWYGYTPKTFSFEAYNISVLSGSTIKYENDGEMQNRILMTINNSEKNKVITVIVAYPNNREFRGIEGGSNIKEIKGKDYGLVTPQITKYSSVNAVSNNIKITPEKESLFIYKTFNITLNSETLNKFNPNTEETKNLSYAINNIMAYTSAKSGEDDELYMWILGSFAGGAGTAGDPYQISNCTNLNEIRTTSLSASYILINDINCGGAEFQSGAGWTSISMFSGVFDGKNFTISNLFQNQTTNSNTGLFGDMESATDIIKNVHLVNVSIWCGSYCGAVGGYVSGTNAYNISATGTVQHYAGKSAIGGVYGRQDSGTLKNGYSNVNVSGAANVGGFIGTGQGGTIVNAYSSGKVVNTSSSGGGFMGNKASTTTTNCFWDTQTSTLPNSASTATGKTTAQMKEITTFLTGTWDIVNMASLTSQTWYIDNGTDYPRLGNSYVAPATTIYTHLIAPNNNTNTINTTLQFYCNASTSGILSSLTFYVFNSSGQIKNQTTLDLAKNTYNQTALNITLTDDTYKWNCLSNSSLNIRNWTDDGNWTFTIDTTKPFINITYPINNSNFSVNTIDVNWTTTDLRLSACWWANDSFTINNTITCGTNITTIVWSEGVHNVRVYSNDTLGNVNASQVKFLVDTVKPVVVIVTPLNNTNSSNNNLDINYTYTETNPSSCWWSADGFDTNTTLANCGTNITAVTWGVQGQHYVRIYMNDSLGNTNSTQVTFRIDTLPPYFTFIPANKILTYGQTFWVNYSFSDAQVNGSYAINDTRFSINSSGSLKNATVLSASKVYYINVTINDSVNNLNSTIFNLTINPVNSTTTTSVSPASPIAYGLNSNFSCSNNMSQTTELYINSVNKTTEKGLNVNRSAGTYNVSCLFYGNVNITARGSETSYTINKATGLVYTYSDLRANKTIEQNFTMWLNSSIITGNWDTGNLSLYKNSVRINYGNSQNLSNYTTFDVVGLFNITSFYSGNTNYTSDYETWFVNVTVIAGNMSLEGNGNINAELNSRVNISYQTNVSACIDIRHPSYGINTYCSSAGLSNFSFNITYFRNDLFSNTSEYFKNLTFLGPQNQTIYFASHQFDEVDNLTINISGSLYNGTYPNVKVYINNTLSNTLGMLYTGTIFSNKFNDSSTYQTNYYTETETKMAYLRIPKLSSVLYGYANITGLNNFLCHQYSALINTCGPAGDYWEDTSYFHYLKPSYANSSSTLEIQKFSSGAFSEGVDETYNITLSANATLASCWTYGPNLTFRDGTQFSGCTRSIKPYALQCFDGSNWINITSHGSCADVGIGVYKEIFNAMNWRTNTTWDVTNSTLEVGILDGVYEWNKSLSHNNSIITSNFNSTIQSALDTCTADYNGYCDIPMYLSTTSGGLNMTVNFSYTSNINPVTLNHSLVEIFLNKSSGATNVPITIEVLSGYNGSVLLNDLRYDYAGGNKTYQVNLHTGPFNISSYNVTFFFSKWNYNFPNWVDYLEFIPPTPVSKNVTPYGQTSTIPILNLTNYGYGGRNANMFILLNGTSSCVNLYASTNNVKPNPALWDGLVLDMPMDIDARDISGYGNNGTVTGATWNNSGQIGGSYQFGINNNYILLSQNLIISNTSSTLSFWAKEEDISLIKTLFTISLGSYASHIEFSTNGGGSFRIEPDTNNNDIYFNMVRDTNWHNYILVSNSTTCRLYKDGVNVPMSSNMGGIVGGSMGNNLTLRYIGGRTAYSNVTNGSIDEVKIYNRTLTSQEISEYYTQTSNKYYESKLSNTWTINNWNAEYLNNSKLWMWADYGCNYTYWSVWQPDLYFRNCALNTTCSTEIE